MVNNPPASTGDSRDMSSIPGVGSFPEEGHGNPLQCSCLEVTRCSLVHHAGSVAISKGSGKAGRSGDCIYRVLAVGRAC